MVTKSTRGILSKISGVIHIDLTYYLGGGVWLTLSTGVALISSFALSALFARFTSKEFYGQYKFVFSLLSLLAIFSLPGMDTAVTQSIAQGYKNSFLKATQEKLRWSLVGCIGLIVTAIYYFHHQKNLGWVFILALPLFILVYGLPIGPAFIGRKQFKIFGIYNILQNGLRLLLVGMAIFISRSVLVVVVTSLLAQSIVNVMAFPLAFRQSREGIKDDAGLISYGRHLTLINSLTTITLNLSRALLVSFVGFQGLAVYSIASILPDIARGFLKQIRTLTLPKLSKDDVSEVYPKIQARLVYLLLIGFISFLIVALFLPFLILYVYSAKYIDAVLPAEILSISLIFTPLSNVLASALTAQRRKGNLYLAHVVYAIIGIALLIALAPSWGVVGAATSLVAARLGSTLYAWYCVREM